MKVWCKDGKAVPLIPKVATSTLSRVLADAGWEKYGHDVVAADHEFYSLIRHPIDRWISGVATYYTMALDLPSATPDMHWHKKALMDEQLVRWYVMKPTHDAHTREQHLSLGLLPGVKLFRLEDIRVFWETLGVDTWPVHLNPIIDHVRTGRVNVVNHLRAVIARTPEYHYILEDRYARDLELYTKAKR